MTSKEDLQAQLAAVQQELRDAEREIERQKRAAEDQQEELPEGAKALIVAVSKIDLPTFWEADPVLWFRQCESAFRRLGGQAQPRHRQTAERGLLVLLLPPPLHQFQRQRRIRASQGSPV
jgi:hypothetical protein